MSAVRNTTQALLGRQIIDPKYGQGFDGNGINPETSGLVAYLNITAVPGTDTVQLVLEEQDPASGVWSQVAATTPTAATGMVRMKVKPSITAVAASATGVVVQCLLQLQM